jgi:peptidoglycan/LPS O-acetylase OafA/YrhL
VPDAAAAPSRLPELDALRGIAALLVVWIHVAEVYVRLSPVVRERGTSLLDVAEGLTVGLAGVLLFFMISGFVISKTLQGEPWAGSRRFVLRRFWRLFPAYWLSIPLGVVAISWANNRPQDAATVFANVTMMPTMLLGKQPVIGLYWTLEVELVFYAVCLGLFLLKPVARAWVMVAFAIGAVVLADRFKPGTGRFLLIMMWGALFRFWYDDRGRRVKLGTREVSLGWIVFVSSIVVSSPGVIGTVKLIIPGGDHASGTRAFHAGVPYLLALGIFTWVMLLFPLRQRLLVWLGQISYSLYLFHPVVFYGLFWWLREHAPQPWRELHLGVYLAVNTLLSIAVAAAVYALVERPAISLGRRMTGGS